MIDPFPVPLVIIGSKYDIFHVSNNTLVKLPFSTGMSKTVVIKSGITKWLSNWESQWPSQRTLGSLPLRGREGGRH